MDFLDKRVGVICNELKKLKVKQVKNFKLMYKIHTVGVQGRKLYSPGGCIKRRGSLGKL